MDMRVSGRGMPADAGKLVERHLRHGDHIIDFLKKRSDAKHPSAASRRPTLTVSGAVGSGRGRLASALARELGYELFGREILDAVALDLGCQRKLLDSLDESAQSNIQLMFETWLHGRIIENQEYVRALFRVVSSLAEKGGVVILGRGGAHILGPHAALRIRVEAPLPMRVRRIMETHNLSEDEARQFVETKDHEQRKFHTQFFHTSANDPLSYDLILNLERLSPDKALDLVLCALAARGIETRRAQV
jgi:cytidylate kinase